MVKWRAEPFLCVALVLGSYSCSQRPIPELITAINVNDYRDVTRLLNNGANTNMRQQTGIKHRESQRDADGATPLMIASGYSDARMIHILLRHGAEVNAKDSEGQTALMWAAFTNNDETAQALLEASADASVKDNDGRTAKDIADANNFTNISRILGAAQSGKALRSSGNQTGP